MQIGKPMPSQFGRNDDTRGGAPRRKPAPSWQKGYEESQAKVKAELATGVLSIRTMAKRLGVTTATIKSVAKKLGIEKKDFTTAEFSQFEYDGIKTVIVAMNNAKTNVARPRPR